MERKRVELISRNMAETSTHGYTIYQYPFDPVEFISAVRVIFFIGDQ